LKIKVFTKYPCPQCNATKKTLDRLGLEYTEVAIDSTNRDYLLSMNALSAPVVMITHESGEQEMWSGFRPDSLKALVVT
jgi:glutaredoxin-like protein NrdH